MNTLAELERTLKSLPLENKWEIAQWLLDDIHEASNKENATASNALALPNYAQRRQQIFGNAILPNLILESRDSERW